MTDLTLGLLTLVVSGVWISRRELTLLTASRSDAANKDINARSDIIPFAKLAKNTPIVQVITANNPSGAIIKITHATPALLTATIQVRYSTNCRKNSLDIVK